MFESESIQENSYRLHKKPWYFWPALTFFFLMSVLGVGFTVWFSVNGINQSQDSRGEASSLGLPGSLVQSNITELVTGPPGYSYSIYSPKLVDLKNGSYKLYYGKNVIGQNELECDHIYSMISSNPTSTSWTNEVVELYPGSSNHATTETYKGGDENCVHDPSVRYDLTSGMWFMYYTGAGGTTTADVDAASRIFVATSQDGSTWIKHGLVQGIGQQLGAGNQFFHPDILIQNGKFYLYYYIEQRPNSSIYLAESSDGKNFTVTQALGINGQNPDISFDDGVYYLAYNKPSRYDISPIEATSSTPEVSKRF